MSAEKLFFFYLHCVVVVLQHVEIRITLGRVNTLIHFGYLCTDVCSTNVSEDT